MSRQSAIWKSLAAAALSGLAAWANRRTKQRSFKGESTSPGQSGAGATRDLTSRELGLIRPEYSPDVDGAPDPGEVVWTWVPFVENDGRGKDRPVLIIARIEQNAWAACYLSTKAHRDFVSVGRGAWDSQGRESFLAVDRVLRVTQEGMRREATAIDRNHFQNAVSAMMKYHRLV